MKSKALKAKPSQQGENQDLVNTLATVNLQLPLDFVIW